MGREGRDRGHRWLLLCPSLRERGTGGNGGSGGRTFEGSVQLNPVLADEVAVVFAQPVLGVLSQVLWVLVFWRGGLRRCRVIRDISILGIRSTETTVKSFIRSRRSCASRSWTIICGPVCEDQSMEVTPTLPSLLHTHGTAKTLLRSKPYICYPFVLEFGSCQIKDGSWMLHLSRSV